METSTSTRPAPRRRIPLIFLVIALLWILPCICRFADDVLPRSGHWASESFSELERIRRELPLAEARWRLHNITDYEIHTDACYDFSEDFSGWDLKIVQNEIVFDNNGQKGTLEWCRIGDLLPPKVFDTIRRRIKDANPFEQYLRVDFDPVYGYVSKYVSDFVWYPGTVCADCQSEYIFRNFRPKKP